MALTRVLHESPARNDTKQPLSRPATNTGTAWLAGAIIGTLHGMLPELRQRPLWTTTHSELQHLSAMHLNWSMWAPRQVASAMIGQMVVTS